MYRRLTWIALLICLLCASDACHARKKGYRFKTTAASGADKNGTTSFKICEVFPDSAMIGKYLDGNVQTGSILNNIILTGFDKKRNNSKESFFIINKSESQITGVAVAIEYLTPDGRMLNKRYAILTITIPAEETRKVDIPAWDTQHSFYYVESDPDPSRGNPFTVIMTPLAVSQDFMKSDNAE